MEDWEQQIADLGYPRPPRHVLTVEQAQEYVANLRLQDLNLKALQTLARMQQVSTQGSKAVLLQLLQARNIRVPPLISFAPGLRVSECTEWSVAEREQFARLYGVKFDSNHTIFCQRIVGTIQSLGDPTLEIEVQTTLDRPEQHLQIPLACGSLNNTELLAVARSEGIVVRDRTNEGMCRLLNRTLPWGTPIAALHSPVILPPHLPRSTFGRPAGCENNDVRRVKHRYLEDGYHYCFAVEDEDLLRTGKINPFTGKALRVEFLEDLGAVGEPVDPEVMCTDCPREPCYNVTPLSERTMKWLRNWMDRGVFDQFSLVYRIDPYVRLELAPFKRCTPVTAYRGMSFTEELYRQFTEENPGPAYTTLVLTSWTTDLRKAIEYGSNEDYVIVMQASFLPADVFVDTRLISPRVYRELNATPQNEVIVLPGTYDVEIIERGLYNEQEYEGSYQDDQGDY